ncbi:MAG: hypothetical protein ACREDO_12875 [Methyloceanibacter sp.]
MRCALALSADALAEDHTSSGPRRPEGGFYAGAGGALFGTEPRSSMPSAMR